MKKINFFLAGIFILGTVVFFSCQKDSTEQSPSVTANAGPPKKTVLDAPILACGTATQASINIVVTAGASGAPAGFSIQWMSAADFAATGWPANSDDPANPTSFCKASFSGNANSSVYALAPGATATVNIGELLFDNGASTNCPQALVCGTAYVFRSFAHATSALSKSAFSTPALTCSTLPCTEVAGCTYTQGYWKTHGPSGCLNGNNTYSWPLTEATGTTLTLGTVVYDTAQLCSILNQPAQGNGLLTLAHQLIAAKLNIANGADGSAIAATIAEADALIGGLVIPPVGLGSVPASNTSALVATLTSYNEGAIGPGHCP